MIRLLRHPFVLGFCWLLALSSSWSPSAQRAIAEESFRPPAVPLVACDPYFSIWSQADHLYDTETTHWTGKPHRLTAFVRVDGKAYRLMGSAPESLPVVPQTSLEVLPTRTIYQFTNASVVVSLRFTTPSLPGDLMVLSRPTTYVTCSVASSDGRSHDVGFYLDAGGELVSNTLDQQVTGSRECFEKACALKIGTVSQRVLRQAGDDIRIDWGFLYLAVAMEANARLVFGSPDGAKNAFIEGGAAGVASQKAEFPIAAGEVVAGVAMELGKVAEQPVSQYVVLAYDDLYSIEFMKTKLRPYWRKDGWEASDLIDAAIADYVELESKCAQFDSELNADLRREGGPNYARIAALAYRQCFAAGKFVADANGQPLQFCKENHSNGCIATSDVFYPMSPQFILLGPTLTKTVLVPFMEYAASERWQFPFAPHDLGTYPKANGQRYGGGERSEENQMPVEESGNLLILFAALAKMEHNADFAAKYWDQLSQWAEYLREKGFDPENQLCTDDFAGHMAHNVNLSAKAICGLRSYSLLCQMRGKREEADRYAQVAREFAQRWVTEASRGDHYRLAFDRPDTWSQKYNLVWDRILGLGLFPDEVRKTEMAFYRKIQHPYGLPLDSRSDYTKLDWVLWSATLTNQLDDFEAIVDPVYRFLNETPDRSPMTDWYFTSTAKKRGFTARPVVGGVFLKMLYNDSIWSKYASMDVTRGWVWAKLPLPPKWKPLVATSENRDVLWDYTTRRPEGDWFAPDYAAEGWKQGLGGFGTEGTPGTRVRTRWDSSDIWVRRTFELQSPLPKQVALRLHHDEEARIFINGQLVAILGGWTTSYEPEDIPASALREGKNVMAIHCHQEYGGQYIDCGLDVIVPR